MPCPHSQLAVVRRQLADDVERVLTKSPEDAAAGDGALRRFSAFMTPGMLCIFVHRVAHFLFVRGWRSTARALAGAGAVVFKAAISPASCIGGGLFLPHPVGVLFHGSAGERLTVYSMGVCTSAATFGGLEDAPRLGDDVTIAVHATVIGCVSVGDRTRIAFRVALRHDAPADRVVVARTMRVSQGDDA